MLQADRLGATLCDPDERALTKEFLTRDPLLSVGALRRTWEVSANSDSIGDRWSTQVEDGLDEHAPACLEC